MYERMLDKNNEPTKEQIREYIGEDSYRLLAKLEDCLMSHYELSKLAAMPQED